ncbi:TNFAIP3-interacting protein 3-like [Kryptolebias marmoratus]|uniref:TNFAIP3-interacting protein 3-like n=1 Tax=Kryptolebias marmoratus TaxID=37003 RepID=UPI0007F88C64|nr:TNFAIP3-interacting protein 3-like [Kryptolebias marmoratus]
MSARKSLKESPAATTGQAADHEQVSRLYPSLPNASRFEVCLPLGDAVEKLHAEKSACHRLGLPADAQPEESVSTYERLKVLEEQNKELLAINKKWAKEYRVMEHYYREKIQHLKALQPSGLSEGEEEEERDVEFFKKEERGKAERQTGGDAADELRAQNRTLTRRGARQQEEIRRLNKALEEALLTSRQLGGSSETPQDVWKHQVELYKDDFMRERKDREKLKAKYLELEKRYRKAHSELSALRSQVPSPRPVHCCSCASRAKQSNWEANQPST